ncbi:extracellular solute-binding protein [Pseudonocardia alni]|uniref:extracellular solute-binding protein n=1 Tax=Pseudonocardia alni TaxID=33907 RepID=UPI0033D1F589
MTRPRRLVAAAAALTAAMLLSACGGGTSATAADGAASLDGQRLVWVNYGGVGLEAAQKGWLDPFSEKTGVQFATDSPSDLAKVKAMVEAGNTSWDVIDIDVSQAGANCGTLFEKRPADLDISTIDPKYVTDDCGVPIITQAVTLVYNKKLFGANPPTRITDYMDQARFPGKRMLFNNATGSAEPLLMAAGVPAEQVYPLDWKRLEGAVRELGPNLVAQPTLAQMGASLESGDFAMCLCYTGRTALAQKNGADVGIVWDSTWVGWDGAYAIKGSKAPQAQTAFLQYLATPESDGFYRYLPYGSTITGAQPDVPADFQAAMPEFNRDAIKHESVMDVTYWRDDVDAKFAEWARILSG